MGSYCRYCGQRCFVVRRLPEGHGCDDVCAAVGHTLALATCAPGMGHDRAVSGYDHQTAINPTEGAMQ